jgi:TldD protein
MKELVEVALNQLELARVDYGDVRVVVGRSESAEVRNGVPESISRSESRGVGIRVLVDGCWGFAATGSLTRREVLRAARLAVKVARASTLVRAGRVTLAEVGPAIASYETPYQRDPFAVPLTEKLDVLVRASDLMRKPAVRVAQAFFSAHDTRKLFASTEGARIEQHIVETGGGIAASAVTEGDVQVRSYPNSFRGNFATAGYEYFQALDVVSQAERVAEEAVALLSAPQCPSGRRDVILAGSQLALQVHESIGHPIELDRVLGTEASYAGTSFLTPDKLNNLKYGSDLINVVADATVPGGLGTFGYDDEGVAAQRSDVIKAGLFVGYLMSRETAPVLGRRSNGAMRADGWGNAPLIRMTNINLLPGDWELANLIADTEGGLYLDVNRSWSIDDHRLNFQFGTEAAWDIQGGRLGRMYKNPTYTGITPEFWNSCDAICSERHWRMWGTPNCGKGEPGQTAHVGHGAAPARFRNVQVGVIK